MVIFSERIGIVEPPTTLQIDSMNGALRNSLWNFLYDLYQDDRTDSWKSIAKWIVNNLAQRARLWFAPGRGLVCLAP